MTNQKGTIRILLLIIVVALVAALVYVVGVPKSERNGTPAPPAPSPVSQDETAGWKTYRNQEYGFEVKYPSDFQILVPEHGEVDFVQLYVRRDNEDEFSIVARKADSSASDKYYAGTASESIGQIRISGIVWQKIIIPGESSKNSPYLLLQTKHNNYLYQVQLYGGQQVTGIYQQILSTFKFTPH